MDPKHLQKLVDDTEAAVVKKLIDNLWGLGFLLYSQRHKILAFFKKAQTPSTGNVTVDTIQPVFPTSITFSQRSVSAGLVFGTPTYIRTASVTSTFSEPTNVTGFAITRTK